MTDTSHSRTLAETLEAMAALTPAQHALLERDFAALRHP